jgi:hypothetical protein
LATQNKKFVIKNGLAVGGASGIIDIVDSNGTWIGATGILHGATGPAGSNGATGVSVQGASGATGSAGTNGATGSAGTNGATGSAGTNGATGSAGTNGATGSQGIQGASGVDGTNGATGSAGTNGATGLTGATGAGVQGASGATGIQGPAGQSSSYYSYKASTASQSGDPGNGYITWDNATILSANTLQVSHLTNDSFDIDIFLAIISIGDTLIIQDANDSSRFQKWQVTGTPVVFTNQYYEYPVTLLDSGGAALTNNHVIILAVVSTPVDGATGPQGASGVNGATGPAGSNGTNGASGFVGSNGATGSAGVNGATGIQGASGSTGTNGATGVTGSNGTNGATGPTGATGVGVSGATGIIQNWIVKTTTYTAVNKDAIAADTSGGAFTITLPASPSTGDSVTFADSGHSFNTNNLTIARNGSTIESSATNLVVDVSNIFLSLIYDGTTWKAFSTVGVQGASGSNGTNGATGPAGTNGATGSAGSNGTNGATGSAGSNGTNGATGVQGIQGASGSAGTNGASGFVGSNGATGSAGSNGTNGATGIQGATGPAGVAGATGMGTGVNVSNLGATGIDYYASFIGSTGPLTDVYLANTNVKYNPSTTLFSAPFINATGTITGSLTSGAISYGTLNYSDVNIMASFASSVNTYNQVLLQNGSNDTSASANFVVSNDLATNSTNYGDFGMNSSGFNGGSDCEFHKANTVYLAAQSADLAIGTYGTNNVHFIVNNSVVESMTINANTSIQVNSPLKVTTGATGFTGATGAVGAPTGYFNSLYVNGSAISGGGASITDDTTTNASYYPAMYSVTTGSPSTVYTSSSKIYFNPSTGTLNSTIYNSLSDENKKKNIKTIDNALDTVNQLNGVEFDWKDTDVKSYGVIAQEIEKVLPDLVTMDDQGNKSVNYNGLFGFLINAIKEQQKQIDDLKGKNK